MEDLSSAVGADEPASPSISVASSAPTAALSRAQPKPAASFLQSNGCAVLLLLAVLVMAVVYIHYWRRASTSQVPVPIARAAPRLLAPKAAAKPPAMEAEGGDVEEAEGAIQRATAKDPNFKTWERLQQERSEVESQRQALSVEQAQ